MNRQQRRKSGRDSDAGIPNGATVRVGTYRRISTDEVNQPYSLAAQEAGLEAFVASQPGYVITHRFVDQASGATLERPGLKEALALAAEGAFDVLLVYRIDRLTRSIVGLMYIVSSLDATGVALKSATEPIDTNSPVGRMLVQLLAIFAEFERSLLIDRISAGFDRKAARGEWLSGKGPFGFITDPPNKSLLPLDSEATIVKEIFTKFVEELIGAPGIADWLNATGRRFRGGRLWTKSQVLRLLRNPVYIGMISHIGEVHEGKHEGIVDQETFDAAQKLFAVRADAANPKGPNRSDYLLSGSELLRCTACNSTYTGTGAYGRNGTHYRYYSCTNRQARGPLACSSKTVPADDLEDAIIAAVLEQHEDLDVFEEAVATALSATRDETPRLEADLASTNQQLQEATVAIDRYLRAFEAGSMSDTVCGRRVAELSTQRDELFVHREQLAQQLRATPAEAPSRTELESMRKNFAEALKAESPEVLKQTLASLVQRIEISPDREVVPYFRVPTSGDTVTLSQRGGDKTPVRIALPHVETSGLEPPTPWLQTRCSTS